MPKRFVGALASISLLSATASAQQRPIAASVRVHVESSTDVVLEAQDGETWTRACSGACDRSLPLATSSYRITGRGIRSSRPFQLVPGPGGNAHIVVTPSSSAAFGVGLVSLILGANAAVAGVGLAVLGSFQFSCLSPECRPHDDTASNVGLVMFVLGVVAAMIGGTVVGANGPTDVDNVAAPSRARSPEWRDGSQLMASSAMTSPAATVSVPLFGVAF